MASGSASNQSNVAAVDFQPNFTDSGRRRAVRRRTKTGCLTCRRRRIKCDERHPTCRNCEKSRRDCDYNVRLVLPSDSADQGYYAPDGAEASASAAQQRSLSLGRSESFLESMPPVTSSVEAGHPFLPAQWPVAAASGNVSQISDPTYSAFDRTNMVPSEYMPWHVDSDDSTRHPSWSGAQPEGAILAHHGYPNAQFGFAPSYDPQQFGWTDPASGHGSAFSSVSDGQPATIPHSRATSDAQVTMFPTGPAYRSAFHHQTVDGSQVSTWPLPMSTTGERWDEFQVSTQITMGQILEDAACEVQDDEYYDVFPGEGLDEEEEDKTSVFTGSGLEQDQDRLTSVLQSGSRGFLEPRLQTVSVRLPEFTSNPLKYDAAKYVFRHFITHTGPAISGFERWHFADEEKQHAGGIMSLWTSLIPARALKDPVLLQTILAVSSYTLARQYDANTSPSLRHYAWALRQMRKRRRILLKDGKSISSVGTVAGTMLLAFYEVLTANHLQWTARMAEARDLMEKCDFSTIFHDLHEVQQGRKHLPERTLQRYAALQDLRWWYFKQEMFFSIIGGVNLQIPIDIWQANPLRAAIGDADDICGTMDHLVQLNGIIANFAADDRPRKTSQQLRTQYTTGTDPSDTEPEPVAHARATSYALGRWNQLFTSLQNLHQLFSHAPSFLPIINESSSTASTPFGRPPTRFIHPSVGLVWSFFHMAYICLHRAHPTMPADPYVAVVAARQRTELHALEIGRIAAGIAPDLTSDPLRLGTYVELIGPLFVAGLQFQTADQRAWLVIRAHAILTHSGWGSALPIAHGCETAWFKMGQAGVGPPYLRTVSSDELKSGKISAAIGSEGMQIGVGQEDSVEDTDHEGPDGENAHEKRFVLTSAGARVARAAGLLGDLNEQVEQLSLEN